MNICKCTYMYLQRQLKHVKTPYQTHLRNTVMKCFHVFLGQVCNNAKEWSMVQWWDLHPKIDWEGDYVFQIHVGRVDWFYTCWKLGQGTKLGSMTDDQRPHCPKSSRLPHFFSFPLNIPAGPRATHTHFGRVVAVPQIDREENQKVNVERMRTAESEPKDAQKSPRNSPHVS